MLLNSPAGHGAQVLFEMNAPAAQNSHCVAPAVDTFPSGHAVQLLAPLISPYCPAGHSEQSSSESWSMLSVPSSAMNVPVPQLKHFI